jgi:MoaA/NifB/PqqE/SkfB family radical SAM enzyme
MPSGLKPGLRFQPPSWLLVHGAGRLRVVDLERGDGFDADGLLQAQLEAGDARAAATLRALGQLDATVARFAADYSASTTVPLTRSALLAGTGYQRLFLELTAQCNERCTHCYAESAPERTEALPWEWIEQAIEDARRLNFHSVQLTGGDPLISKHVGRAARLVRELGIPQLEVYTNGLALTDAVYAPLREARADFAFSFYSADPALHDAVTRTPGSQVRTLAAIKRVTSDGLVARGSIILSSLNQHTVQATVDALLAAGVKRDHISIGQVRDVGRGEYQPEVGEALVGGSSGHGGAPMDYTGRRLPGKASVAGDGTVYPCIFSRKLPLGNLAERRLFDILTDERPIETEADELVERSLQLENAMACWECRVRNVLLTPPAPLVSLRPKPLAPSH